MTMNDIRLALIAGTDIPIPECKAVIHQPSIKEIAYLGEQIFFTGVQCLCIQKTMVIDNPDLLKEMTNFKVFMTLMNDKGGRDKKNDVIDVCTLLFPSYKLSFTPRALFFNKADQNFIIDEENFEFLQEKLEMMFCLRDTDQASFNPQDPLAKQIADKLMRARERVAQQKSTGESGGSTFSQYISILTVGLESMSIHDLLNCTVYQLYDLVERFMLYTNWDIDVRSRLAGGKPDSQPENWMKILH